MYLSGGKPGYLLDVLAGSALGRALADAHERGAVLAGCSAGAMVLAGYTFDFRVRLLPWPLRWQAALGFAPGASVVPHYDAWPEPMSALVALQAPRGSVVLGIDEETAVIGRDGVVAGPRRLAGDGLARPATRPPPGRGRVPHLTRGSVVDGRESERPTSVGRRPSSAGVGWVRRLRRPG